jgi:DNA-directed RNA polymerase specialized sigma24 family protein
MAEERSWFRCQESQIRKPPDNVEDAEDAVQQAFLDAWEEHRRRPVRNWGGSLRCLVTRRTIDLLRQRRK